METLSFEPTEKHEGVNTWSGDEISRNPIAMEGNFIRHAKNGINSFPVVSVSNTDCVENQEQRYRIGYAEEGYTKGCKLSSSKDIFKIKTIGKKNLEPLPTIESYLDKGDRKSWGYKSVLFWKQDSMSVASSSDTEDLLSLSEYKDEPVVTEKVEPSMTNREVNDLLKEVEDLQRKFIDPFLPQESSNEDSDNSSDSPVYVLEIPENSVERYSPIYKGISECLDKILQIYDEEMMDAAPKTSDTCEGGLEVSSASPGLQDSGQTPDQVPRAPSLLRASEVNDEMGRKDIDFENAKSTISAFINSDHRSQTEQRGDLLNVNVLDGIKLVQQTLQEIGHEIKNVRRSRSLSCKRDPNVILSDLLAQIQPPRQSRTSFPKSCPSGDLGRSQSLENPAEGVDRDSTVKICEQVNVLKSSMYTPVDSNRGLTTGDRSTEGIYFQPDVSQDEVKPAGNLNHVYENLKEVRHVAYRDELSLRWNNTFPGTVDTRRNSVPALAICNGYLDASPQTSPLYERRGSSWSTTTGVMNYDSGFSEFPRSSTDKNLLTSPEAPDSQRSFEQAFLARREDIESETSTDWSPNSTLSRDQAARKPRLSTRNARSRGSPKRRSTSATSSGRPSCPVNSTLSCPNFSPYLNVGSDSSGMYSKAELDAIRKFLALTSHYFSSRLSDDEEKTDHSRNDSTDINVIRETIQRQKDDLEKQRQQQEELLHQIGDMLLEIVNLKEEHVSVRQRQAKALTILKKQLDYYRKEQEKAQKDLKDQVKHLGDKLESQLNLLQDRSWLDSPASLDRLSVSTNQDCMSRGEIVWKIPNISKKRAKIHSGQSDGVVVSDHFYSQPYGYKMAAWLYLNGRGDYRGKGISVYVCILVGEYDAILTWPIRPRYRFVLVDQNSNAEERRDHVKVRRILDIANRGENAIAKHGGIPRPQPGSKSLIVGFDDFISEQDMIARSFIVDDTLFLKIAADNFN